MVRTRFAPSPTGYLHIGGVRTALFNWLFARQHGGQFLLRIDDTDAERNVEAALKPILDGFRWLGIDWDEGPEVGGPHAPYFQSQRSAQYQAAVAKLLASGHAYRDFAKPEEIAAERAAAEQEKRTFTYSRRWMAESDADVQQFLDQGRAEFGVVRLKMPREGKLVIPDMIRGNVEFQWASEQDHVIQRADGTCLYHLASVVDDFDFEISHVIRAEEHLSNTPRQIFIAQSLGYPLPEYAHLPYVAEPGSKNKLSKRKLDKYLKNKDFIRIHEHGTNIERSLRDAYRKSESLTLRIAAHFLNKFRAIELENNTPNMDYVKVFEDEVLPVLMKKIDEINSQNTRLTEAEATYKRDIAKGIPAYLNQESVLDVFNEGLSIITKLQSGPIAETFNPVIVDFYEQVGYLPDAIINYLLLLGWSLDDKTEFFTRDEMIKLFSLARVNSAPASFDPKKLQAFQDHSFQQLPAKQKVPRMIDYLQRAGLLPGKTDCATGPYLLKIIEAAGDRLKVFGDIVNFAEFFVSDEKLVVDAAAVEKTFAKPESRELLAAFHDALAKIETESFDVATLEIALQQFVAARGIKPGELIHPVRLAICGKTVGMGLYDTLAILGLQRCLKRIELLLAKLPQPTT